MNPVWIKKKLTFLLIPDPDKQVRRFHVPLFVMYLIPSATAMMIIAAILLAAAHSMTVQENAALKEERQAALDRYALNVAEKEEVIGSLQDEIIRLSQEAEKLAERIAHLQSLEKELLTITEDADLELPAAEWDVSDSEEEPTAAGGEYVPLETEDLLAMSRETIQKYKGLIQQVERLEASLAQALAEAEKAVHLNSITPSIYPTLSTRITSAFGYRKDPFTKRNAYHKGIDFGGNKGDPVFATAAGTVKRTGFDAAMGNYIFIDHGNGLETAYMHLAKSYVQNGQYVQKGEKIGLLGSTGRSTGPHLHYEVHQNSKPVNPKLYLTDQKG